MADCSGFLPVAVNFLRRVPVIGMLLYLPGISHVRNTVSEIVHIITELHSI